MHSLNPHSSRCEQSIRARFPFPCHLIVWCEFCVLLLPARKR